MGTYTTEDGPCLLKQSIVSTFIDTRAMASQICESLVDMAQQLETQKGNITKFNEWVEEQVAILQSRGEEAHNLLTYLWKTYQKALDAKFVEYIQNLCNDFITGKSDFAVPNQNASVFETHIIPEDESDQGQDDNDLSFQPPDPIQAINNSETGCCTDHPTKTTTEDIQQTHNDATSAGEFSLELPHTMGTNHYWCSR